jgi:hypothetical protein
VPLQGIKTGNLSELCGVYSTGVVAALHQKDWMKANQWMDYRNIRGTVLPLVQLKLVQLKLNDMIKQLNDIPNTMVGFRASKEVTKDDFDKVVLPAVAELIQRTDELNYMLVLDTPLKNFTIGAWIKDALLGLNNLSKWNRVAIVSDSESLNGFTNMFGKIMPGEFKGYTTEQIDNAIQWVSGQGILDKQVYQAEDDLRE